jgi:folate-binding protein YgfZ
MIPASSTGHDAARHGAARIDRTARGRIVVSGADRRSYLQGLLTNDIAALAAGEGCYSAYLTAQGRMIADMHVYELGDVILMTLAGDVKDIVLAKLDQFVFSEDVQLGDVTATFAQWAIVGPRAAQTIAAASDGVAEGDLDSLPEHGNRRFTWRGSPAIVTRTNDAGVPGFDVYVDAARREEFERALDDAGAILVGDELADAIRIEGGVPLFHRDMDEDTIPLEAGIESRAISFTKGCYVGQEVIIRVLHRGHGRVARKLVGLRIAGDSVPARESPVSAADKEIGRVTSSAWSPALNQPIALAYVHRDFVEPGTSVHVGGAIAEVSALPFVSVAS